MTANHHLDGMRRRALAYGVMIGGVIESVNKALPVLEKTRMEALTRQQKIESLQAVAKCLLIKRLAETGRIRIPGADSCCSEMEDGLLALEAMVMDLRVTIEGEFVDLVTSVPALGPEIRIR